MNNNNNNNGNEPFPTPFDEDAELPFGMAGVTRLLDRLREGVSSAWEPEKSNMVARYLLDLADCYWLSDEEMAYCRGFVSLN